MEKSGKKEKKNRKRRIIYNLLIITSPPPPPPPPRLLRLILLILLVTNLTGGIIICIVCTYLLVMSYGYFNFVAAFRGGPVGYLLFISVRMRSGTLQLTARCASFFFFLLRITLFFSLQLPPRAPCSGVRWEEGRWGVTAQTTVFFVFCFGFIPGPLVPFS